MRARVTIPTGGERARVFTRFDFSSAHTLGAVLCLPHGYQSERYMRARVTIPTGEERARVFVR